MMYDSREQNFNTVGVTQLKTYFDNQDYIY